jgi:hypothetical protein
VQIENQEVIMNRCDICEKDIKQGDGYLLTTREVVTSQEYWNKVFSSPSFIAASRLVSASMMDPESYKIQYMSMQTAQKNPWLVCADCVSLFKVDTEKTRQYATQWHDSGGQFTPPGSGAVSLSYINTGRYHTQPSTSQIPSKPSFLQDTQNAFVAETKIDSKLKKRVNAALFTAVLGIVFFGIFIEPLAFFWSKKAIQEIKETDRSQALLPRARAARVISLVVMIFWIFICLIWGFLIASGNV